MPGASASSSAVPTVTLQAPTPPMIPPPPIPVTKDQLSSRSQGSSDSSQVQPKAKPHFSTVIGQVRAGAIRMDITNPEECQCAFPCCPVKGAVLAFFLSFNFFCLIAWRRRFFELLSSTSVPHHRPLTSRETPSHSKPTSAATMCVL